MADESQEAQRTPATPSENPGADRVPSGPGRLRRALGWLALSPWLAVLLAWLVGRAVGDRLLWTQYLEWIPTEAVAVSGLVAILLARLAAGRRWRGGRLPLVLVAGVTLWLTLGEWSLWRAVLPGESGPADFRVVFLNVSPGAETADLSPVFERNAGLVVLSNVHPNRVSFEKIYGIKKESLLERTVRVEPGRTPPDEVHVLSYASFFVCSKWPIRRFAAVSVGKQETWLENDTQGGAGVLLLEIERPDGPLIVWAVDMPSTLGASRRELFESVARKIREGNRVMVFDEMGRRIFAERTAGDPLLLPDLVAGDFNTPGHAWSVSRFRPGLRPVRADTGFGPRGTWPADLPLFEIDLARLGPGLTAVRSGRIRCDGCRHLGLWADLDRYHPPLP